jgi:SAM-dependent methyltransferase
MAHNNSKVLPQISDQDQQNCKFYNWLLSQRSTLLPEFDELQKDTARAITDIIRRINQVADLYEDNQPAPAIKYIIDVGCGTGEILSEIKANLKKASYYDAGDKASFPHCYGFDISSEEVQRANKDHGKLATFKSTNYYFEQPENADPEKTMLLCVGHTLPHFVDLEGFINKVGAIKPKFILVDFHENWDEVIDKVRDNTSVLEPFAIAHAEGKHPAVWILESKKMPRGELTQRGIRTISQRLQHYSLQRTAKSEYFLNLLNKKGYLTVSRVTYRSGYGHKVAYLLVQYGDSARELNNCFQESISCLFKKWFETENVKKALGATPIAMLAAVVLPFDPILTFAKYSAIPGLPEPPENLRKDLLVGPPSLFNYRIDTPLAFGIYRSILDHSVQQVVLRLPDATVSTCDVDDSFAENEKQHLLTVHQLKPDAQNSKLFFTQLRGFISIPVYFGTLPLFCLYIAERLDHSMTYSPAIMAAIIELLRGDGALRLQDLAFKTLQNFALSAMGAQEPKQVQGLVRAAQSKPWKTWLDGSPARRLAFAGRYEADANRLITMLTDCERDATPDWPIIFLLARNRFRVGNMECSFFGREKHNYDKGFHPKAAKLIIPLIRALQTTSNTDGFTALSEWTVQHLTKIAAEVSAQSEFEKLRYMFSPEISISQDRITKSFSAYRLATLIKLTTPRLAVVPPITEAGGAKLRILESDIAYDIARLIASFAMLKNLVATCCCKERKINNEQTSGFIEAEIIFSAQWRGDSTVNALLQAIPCSQNYQYDKLSGLCFSVEIEDSGLKRKNGRFFEIIPVYREGGKKNAPKDTGSRR